MKTGVMVLDENRKKLEEARVFFCTEPGLQRFLQACIQKYCQLGRLGGTIHLKDLTPEERESIGALFGRDLSGQQEVRLPLSRFVDILGRTRFADLDPVQILEAWAGHPLLTRQEKQDRFQENRERLWQELRAAFPHPNCRDWLEQIENKGVGTGVVHSQYRKNPEKLKQELTKVLEALSDLPGKEGSSYERLPLFATRITGDPHGFDAGSGAGRLLLSALHYLQNPSGKKMTWRTEAISRLLEDFNLIRDDLNNFVICAGFKGEGTGGRLLEAAGEQGAVINLPLREVAGLKACFPFSENFLKRVFIVENPAVFSALLDGFKGYPTPPIICSNGQFRLATTLFLEKMQGLGLTFLYSGDFDPEGLQMAQNFLERFPREGRLWRMHPDVYSDSGPNIALEKHRLRKLESITHPSLQQLAATLKSQQKAVFQEQILPLLQKDLEGFLTPGQGLQPPSVPE